MWNMIWPLCMVVLCNCMYNICTKSTPANANAFLSLTVTYLISAAVTTAIFFLRGYEGTVLSQLKQLNWTAPVLGLALIGLEFGYICVYRAGWKMSVCSITGNTCLAFALLVIGALLYKEVITLKQILGMAVCLAGLILMNK